MRLAWQASVVSTPRRSRAGTSRMARSTCSAPLIRSQWVSQVDFRVRPTRCPATMPTSPSSHLTPRAVAHQEGRALVYQVLLAPRMKRPPEPMTIPLHGAVALGQVEADHTPEGVVERYLTAHEVAVPCRPEGA